MRSGGTTRVVATWPILVSGVNALICMTLGFPAEFQFFEPWLLNFSSFHFTFPKPPIIAMSIFFSNLSLHSSPNLCVAELSSFSFEVCLSS